MKREKIEFPEFFNDKAFADPEKIGEEQKEALYQMIEGVTYVDRGIVKAGEYDGAELMDVFTRAAAANNAIVEVSEELHSWSNDSAYIIEVTKSRTNLDLSRDTMNVITQSLIERAKIKAMLKQNAPA